MVVYIEWYWQVFYIFVPTIGIISNSLILYVTAVDSRLRSVCNFMIAMIAFGDVFHQLGQYVMVISHDIAPGHVIPQRICMHLQAAPLFGLCFSSVIVLCVAIDRILASKSIYIVIQNHQKLYVAMQMAVAVIFSVAFVVWSYMLVNESNVICGIPDVLTEDEYSTCFGTITIINILLIICYSYMAYSLRRVVFDFVFVPPKMLELPYDQRFFAVIYTFKISSAVDERHQQNSKTVADSCLSAERCRYFTPAAIKRS